MGFAQIPIGANAPAAVNAVIEIPRGTNFKYEYDEQLEVIKLDRVLSSPLFYPVDYGFIPETRSEDGDHLDVLVVVTGPSFPGCLMEVRPLGLLRMRDEKGEDYKILAVPTREPRYRLVTRMEDLSSHIPVEIQHFFEIYKTLEAKEVEIIGWYSLEEAQAEIMRSWEAYRAEHSHGGAPVEPEV
ncbi:MAG: inorganic diphosphatase [Chloroflexia bacterium]